MGCNQSTQRHPERAQQAAPKEPVVVLSPRDEPTLCSPVESTAVSPARLVASPPAALVTSPTTRRSTEFGRSASCGASPASPAFVNQPERIAEATPAQPSEAAQEAASPIVEFVPKTKAPIEEPEDQAVLMPTPRQLALIAPPTNNQRNRRKRSRTPRGRQETEQQQSAHAAADASKENAAPTRGRSPSKRGKSPGRQAACNGQAAQQHGGHSPSRRAAKSPARNRSPMRSGSARRGLAPAADANGVPSRKVQFDAAALVEPRPEETAAAKKERVRKASGKHHGNMREDVFLASLAAFERQLTRKTDLGDHLATR